MSNTKKSFIGPPATDRIVSTPLTLTVYAYATGPVSTANIIDATYQLRTVSRYTISNNINTARAMVTSSGLTTGVSYTFSCKIKYNGTNVATPSFSVDASKGNPEGGANNNTVSSSAGATTSLGNGWYYVTYTWSYSVCPTSGCYLTYGVVTGSDAAYLTNTFDVYEPQFEVGSFATPYVTQSNGVRSTAQALLDLTNKNTITASSLTYASSNTFSFSGSNYLTLPASVGAFGTGNFTINCWWKSSGTQSNYVAIMEQGFTGSPSNGAWAFKITHNTSIINFTYYNGGIVDNLSSFNINDGAWHNYVAVRSGTNLTLYVDSVSQYSLTLPTSYSFGEGSSVFVGYNPRDGTYINGSLPILSVYNRALPAAEIQQNFNALRTRYGI
jgi:hypothetical protein